MYGAIPVHPQPSIFETTVVNVETTESPARVITHHDIEVILAEPAWDVKDMQAKATANLILRGWRKNPEGVMVAPEPTKPAHKVTTTKGPAKKTTASKKAAAARARKELGKP
jgi:hypothetical protein